MTFSVVVPVLNGARYLPELLEAVFAQGHDVEVLVVDSGSADGSVTIAAEAGAKVIEIPNAEFGHGRTRNLAAEHTTGELICFLTQDATPLPGWLDAYAAAFAADVRVGAAFGPHLPRPDTSVMIARELTDFFAGVRPGAHDADDPVFLSNVNACYRRACWEQVRFADVAYAEDQAFARAMGEHGWLRAYVPDAGVLHAHDFSPLGFARRYFDEYRGLRETAGHVEHIGVRSTVRDVRGLVRADHRWMVEQGWTPGRRAAATGRSALHHTTRKLAATLGSHAHKLPAGVERAISLERRATAPPAGPKPTVHRPATGPSPYQPVLDVLRDGPVRLAPPMSGMHAGNLHVAVVIPPFRRGSGGHSTIYNLMSRLEERGHTVSTWIHDPEGRMASEWPAVIRSNLREYFRPVDGPVYKGFDEWYGADVALATGWDTVYAVQRLPHCRARAYLVQDHEPEFFATSAQSVFAERTYAEDLYVIAASPWLLNLVTGRYGGRGRTFQLAAEPTIYHPRPVERRTDTVIFYARDVTPRRAVPLGLLALAELKRRHPEVRVVLFGNDQPIKAPFDYEDLGIATPEELSFAYSEARVGLSLSLTNYSLIPQEMLACGLPCVELAGRSIETVYGSDGPLELAAADPVELADAMERLLEDPVVWERRSQDGLAFVAGHNWEVAATEVQQGLRDALWEREIAQPEEALVPPLAAALPPAWEQSARAIPLERIGSHRVTNALFARLSAADVAAVRERLEPDLVEHWERVDDAERASLALILGTYYEVPSVLAKTGLRPEQPPEDVHAMARGPLAGGGAIYFADLLEDALVRVGGSLANVERGLDFGCSSGRVVRVLEAAYPQAEWHGVDPNEAAIGWALEHLPGIAFSVSPQDPPLAYPDAHFDLVFAISIWSHYAEGAALRWLEEMHRIIRPGGRLVFSTHGLHSVSYYAQTGERSPAQLAQIRRALYRRDHWFAAEFGEEGDWGVKHAEWGTAFFTPEWLSRVALPAWSLEDFAVGQNSDNQDVYVLRRR
ncbi:glycosyltransferase involved in cell wall biosynthesis [Solirubrobacter pauli]|uniref:4,4'-diaponeurosporenoate glycosyltransferase n=1 Tax=Solirubrobacter pauli TaxID=166793 RepID=A0A660LIU4_9ACTN|nr:glycosyltransferase [Solirubrobacter pauli]RKQ92871.1 glycosyltransferase involved in cell wall biosynthesis [Solirubrobacter pauli]